MAEPWLTLVPAFAINAFWAVDKRGERRDWDGQPRLTAGIGLGTTTGEHPR